jgi:hypothetical protein
VYELGDETVPLPSGIAWSFCWNQPGTPICAKGTERAFSSTSRARFVAPSRARAAVAARFETSSIMNVPRTPMMSSTEATSTSTMVRPASARMPRTRVGDRPR